MTLSPFARSARRHTAIAALCGAASLPLFASIFFRLRSIPDLDSYYHLAVARLYAQHGIVRAIPWARFSVLGVYLGDKELLFHLFLAPFASFAAGGRLALAIINAALVTVIGVLAARAAGVRAAAAGLWIFLTAGAFFFRTFRLRPESLALILLLLLVHYLATRRAIAAAVVCALFPLSYTAWHVPLGLAVLVAIATRDRSPRMVLYPAAGTVAGVLLHPHFPDNVRIFWIQNVLFFLRKGGLDVGEEIQAPYLPDILLYNLGFWVGLAVLLWFARRPAARGGRTPRLSPDDPNAAEGAPVLHRERLIWTTAAAVFLLLFLFMERMAVYAIPFTALAVLMWVRDVPRRAVPWLLVCIVLSAPWTRELIAKTRDSGVDERDLAAFGRAVPPGARIAATWGAAEAYAYWAPQGRYLNVLDPVFMAAPHPREWAAQRAIFTGAEPDVATTARRLLASEYLALRVRETPRTLFERLRADPRARLLHSGENVLVGFAPSDAFVTSWSIADPAHPERRGRYAGPGYVDLSPVRAPCADAYAEVSPGIYEIASYGPATLWLGEAARALPPAAAILGHGALVRIDVLSDVHLRTCRDPRSPRLGFYFVRR